MCQPDDFPPYPEPGASCSRPSCGHPYASHDVTEGEPGPCWHIRPGQSRKDCPCDAFAEAMAEPCGMCGHDHGLTAQDIEDGNDAECKIILRLPMAPVIRACYCRSYLRPITDPTDAQMESWVSGPDAEESYHRAWVESREAHR